MKYLIFLRLYLVDTCEPLLTHLPLSLHHLVGPMAPIYANAQILLLCLIVVLLSFFTINLNPLIINIAIKIPYIIIKF